MGDNKGMMNVHKNLAEYCCTIYILNIHSNFLKDLLYLFYFLWQLKLGLNKWAVYSFSTGGNSYLLPCPLSMCTSCWELEWPQLRLTTLFDFVSIPCWSRPCSILYSPLGSISPFCPLSSLSLLHLPTCDKWSCFKLMYIKVEFILRKTKIIGCILSCQQGWWSAV